MRWVWLESRYVKLSLHKHGLLSSIAAPRVSNSGQRHVEQPRLSLQRLTNPSPRSRLHFREKHDAVEHDRPPLSPLERSEVSDRQNANTGAEAVEQRHAYEPAKIEGQNFVSECGDIAKATEATKSLKTAERDSFELDQVASHQKRGECPNVSDRTTIAEDPDLQPTWHSGSFSTCTPLEESVKTLSSSYTGCSIDEHGQLHIQYSAAALRKHRTVLLVSSVSKNMVEADFTRLLACTSGHGNGQGGLVRGTGDCAELRRAFKIADTF